MQVDVGTVMVTALIQGGIATMFYLAVQRTVQRMDDLAKKVDELKDKQLVDTNERLGRHIEKESVARKGMYERIGVLERDCVTLTVCREQHREMMHGQQEFRAAVIDLAAVQQRIENTSKWLGEVNERLIAQGQDLAELRGKLGKG